MTKLMTTVSAMQCVEKGLVGLDDDVAEKLLPEFKDIEVLEDMEDDGNAGEKPRLRNAKGKVTLRFTGFAERRDEQAQLTRSQVSLETLVWSIL